MRIDLSESECSNCFHCRTLNTQEAEPNNVITPAPVSSGLVQALEHDSTNVASTSTTPSAPPVVASSVTSEPSQFSIQASSGFLPPATSTSSASTPPHTSSSPGFGSAPYGSPLSGFGASFSTPTFGSNTPPLQAFGSNRSSFNGFATPAPSIFGSIQAPSTFGSGSGVSSSPTGFGFVPPVRSVSSGTQGLTPTAFGSGAFPPLARPHGLWSIQAPLQASTFGSSPSYSFSKPEQEFGKKAPAAPASPFGNVVAYARPDVGIMPARNTSATTVVFGTTPVSVSSEVGPKHPFSSFGTPPNLFGPNQWSNTPTASHPQPFGFDNGDFVNMVSVSASEPSKSHEELRWEAYKKIIGKGSFVSPIGSTSNAVFPSSTASPPFDTKQGNTNVSSGCTACGATSSSSPSGYFNFNNATTHPSASTSFPGLFYSTAGYVPTMFGATPSLQAYPMMFGTTNLAPQGTTPAHQAYPMMFGTTNLAAQGTSPAHQAYPMMFGTTNFAAQGTTPALENYPVQGLILLPFAAMNLH